MGERQNSILTDTQRDFLRQGGKEGGSARMTRKRIKDRVRAGVLDFRILRRHLPGDLREGIFEDRAVDADPDEIVSNCIIDALAFFYLGVTERSQEMPTTSPVEAFEAVIEKGIQKALNKQGRVVEEMSVDISITESRGENPPEDMTMRELRQVFSMGEIDREEFLDRQTEKRIEELREEGTLSDRSPEQIDNYRIKHRDWLDKQTPDPEDT